MNLKSLAFIVVGLIGSTSVLAAGDHAHEHDHQALHGGVVVEEKDMDYELVAKADVVQLYLTDHGKPVALEGLTAKLTLLSGSERQEVELKPAGDRLEAQGQFNVASHTKVIAVVSGPDKKVSTARFVLP